jgi:hypothetical protein
VADSRRALVAGLRLVPVAKLHLVPSMILLPDLKECK